MTTAVIYIDRKRGDHGGSRSLLTSFQKQFPFKINEINPIRGQVFKINTSKGIFILKGYSSYNRLKLQEAFTSSLKTEGFEQTYTFLSLDQEPIFYNNQYFGCMPFIEPHIQTFTYLYESERQEGLSLLEKYHRTTKQSVQRYQTILPEFILQKKWTERLEQFKKNSKVVGRFIPYEWVFEWINWAEWSLEGIGKGQELIDKEPNVVLHGDVAHHNFLRGKNEKLYLIDFDLISIGPSSMDLLQFANRILPFINWDINRLAQYKSLKKLLHINPYIYALAYPTDLFREWNRLIREQTYENKRKLQQVMELTFSKINQRQRFLLDLKNLV
ncbi:phosphotransferase [Bacillus sp. CGMCC 1.16607]|uniref:phosphotransferase n=1 Tax=Bacillus sp. CGMCC 1.16607 TaxID=3351842 RepID=UPI0036440115